MQVLVLGGSGRTGQLVVAEALAAGHGVTVLVRSAARFRESVSPAILNPSNASASLTIVEGTPLSAPSVRAALAATSPPPRAVLIALNARRASDSPFAAQSPDTPERMMADSARNAIDGLAAAAASAPSGAGGTRKPRIVILSSAGVGSSFANMNCLLRGMFSYTNMRLGLADHEAVDAEARSRGQEVDWVLVRPFMLVDDDDGTKEGRNGEGKKLRVWPDDGAGAPFMPKSSRTGVARFMVEALQSDEFVGRSPVVTN